MRFLLYNFDRHLTQWVMRYIPIQLQPVMVAITMLGDPVVTIGIAVAIGLYGLKYNLRFVYAASIVPLTLMVGAIIKFIVHRARPMHEYIGIIQLDTYSFPSGHSSGSVVAYGLLAYIAWMKLPAPFNYIVALLLCVVPIVVGISRVYLNAHYPSDVVAGWLLGMVGLAAIIFVIRPFVS